jgi:hypothetical protein
VSFHICSDADINIEDGSGGAVASGVPAVVITFGKNANEPGNPSSASETENQAGDEKLFISKDYTSGETDEFDDMLVWIPLNVLIYRMIQAERLP